MEKEMSLEEGSSRKKSRSDTPVTVEAESMHLNNINVYTQKPLSSRYFDILAGRMKLPVHSFREEFLELFRANQLLLLVGETGSGKTGVSVILSLP